MLLGFDAVGAAPVGAAEEETGGSKVKAAQQLDQASQVGQLVGLTAVAYGQQLSTLVQAGSITGVARQDAAQAGLAVLTSGQVRPRDQAAVSGQPIATLAQTGLVGPRPALAGDTPARAALQDGLIGPRPTAATSQVTLPVLTTGDLDTTRHQLAAAHLLDTLSTVLTATVRDLIVAPQITQQNAATADFRSGGVNLAASQATTAPITAGQIGPRPGVQGDTPTLAVTTAGQIGPRVGFQGDTAGREVATVLQAYGRDAVLAPQVTQQAPAGADFVTGVVVRAMQSAPAPVTAGLIGPRPGLAADHTTLPPLTAGQFGPRPGVAAAQTISTLSQAGLVTVAATERATQVTQQNGGVGEVDTLAQVAAAQTTTAPVTAGTLGAGSGLATAQQTSATSATIGRVMPLDQVAVVQPAMPAANTAVVTTTSQGSIQQAMLPAGAIIRVNDPVNAAALRITRITVTSIRIGGASGVSVDQQLRQDQAAAGTAPIVVSGVQVLDAPLQVGDPLDRHVSVAQALPASTNFARARVEAVARGTPAVAPALTQSSAGLGVGMSAAARTAPARQLGEAKTVLAGAGGQLLDAPLWIRIALEPREAGAAQVLPALQGAGAVKAAVSGASAQVSADLETTAKAAPLDAASAAQTLPAVVSSGRLRSRRLLVSPGALLPF